MPTMDERNSEAMTINIISERSHKKPKDKTIKQSPIPIACLETKLIIRRIKPGARQNKFIKHSFQRLKIIPSIKQVIINFNEIWRFLISINDIIKRINNIR